MDGHDAIFGRTHFAALEAYVRECLVVEGTEVVVVQAPAATPFGEGRPSRADQGRKHRLKTFSDPTRLLRCRKIMHDHGRYPLTQTSTRHRALKVHSLNSG
jgi:hypothetical protein